MTQLEFAHKLRSYLNNSHVATWMQVTEDANDLSKLDLGSVINNEALVRMFGVGIMGGMRRNVERNHLVIVSDHTKSLYEDRWEGQILHYTGMGKLGPQTLTAQNRTLYGSRETKIKVYLFEVFKQGRYVFHGEVALAGAPYLERQPDSKQDLRSVWMFPVQLLAVDYTPVPSQDDLSRIRRLRERALRKLSIAQLRALAEGSPAHPPTRPAIGTNFIRSEAVVAYVKKAAGGNCGLCSKPAPFVGRDGQPYLECHHVHHLANGGPDTIANAVALCANCHRKMHALDRARDRETLYSQIQTRDQSAERAPPA